MSTKEKPKAEVTESEEEEYLKYIMRDNTINITVKSGGTVIFQSGHPPVPPPKPPGG